MDWLDTLIDALTTAVIANWQKALITALIGTLLVGVIFKRYTEALLGIVGRFFKYLADIVYRWIAPRNPFSISIRSYRKHVLRSTLARMETPVGPNLAVTLDQTFAPIKVRSGTTQETGDLSMYVARAPRCIVLGGPGTGKTTLMKSLVLNIIKKTCHPDLNDLIPVFITLRDLGRTQQDLTNAIVSSFAKYHFPGADKFVEACLSQGKLIIVLDGLDELGGDRAAVAQNILEFSRFDSLREHSNRLIVTCRENSYRTEDLRDEFGEILRLEPFTYLDMRTFLKGWPPHMGRSALQLYIDIRNDPQISDICRNPLLLTILTGLYLADQHFTIPSSRELFFQRSHRGVVTESARSERNNTGESRV